MKICLLGPLHFIKFVVEAKIHAVELTHRLLMFSLNIKHLVQQK